MSWVEKILVSMGSGEQFEFNSDALILTTHGEKLSIEEAVSELELGLGIDVFGYIDIPGDGVRKTRTRINSRAVASVTVIYGEESGSRFAEA